MVDFYPLDITHDVTDSGPIIILYGRSAGKKICVHYEGFEPYFYASFNESAKDQVQKTSIKEFQVTRIEPHAMSTGEQVFRVFVNVPRAVQAIKKELGDVIRAYEYDFPYERRFLIDHDITLGNKMTFEGEPVQSTNRIPTYLATTLSKCDTNDTYANPIALALDIETYLPKGQRLNMSEQPILMVGLQDREYKKVLTWKPVDHPDVEVLSSEADMLTRLSEIIVERDPDMVVGYNSDGFDMAYIAQRAKHYGLSLRMGVDNTPLKISGREYKRASIAGIVHIDLFQFVRRVMRTSLDTDTLSLDAVSSELLGVGKADVNILNLAADWDAGTNLGEYVKYNIIDIDITLRLFEKIYPNMIELVKVVGVSIFDACRSSFSVLVEWYLIKLAHAQNKLIPNKPGYNEQQRRMKEHVKGGFVFSPTPGLYEDVVVYDFRSLYPSIIASHNVSPETINCDCCENGEIDGVYGSYHFCKQRKGFISGAISELIKLRAVIKKELRTNKDDPLLNARSIALKLLANSMYGYLGFALARWYSIQSADATTAYGRKYVNDVIADAGKAGFHVVYGDTDSAMLTLGDKSREEALAFCESVNKELPGLMELEVEDFYPRALFVSTKGSDSGAKKKYAMVDDDGKLKIRGFATVRRNWSPVAKKLQREVLQLLLEKGDVDTAVKHVKDVIKGLREHTVPVREVAILTQLQKELKDYASRGPHVAAAQRMQDQGIDVGPGAYIRYVVIAGKGLIRDRVRLPEEPEAAQYDSDYYIDNQVLPSVDRIFDALGYSVEELLSKGKQSSLGDW